MKKQPKRTPSQTKRELINKFLPYELYAFTTMRYYAQLQGIGALDIVELIMHVEGVSERDALGRCMGMLHEASEERFNFVARNIELISQDPSLDFLSDHFKNN